MVVEKARVVLRRVALWVDVLRVALALVVAPPLDTPSRTHDPASSEGHLAEDTLIQAAVEWHGSSHEVEEGFHIARAATPCTPNVVPWEVLLLHREPVDTFPVDRRHDSHPVAGRPWDRRP